MDIQWYPGHMAKSRRQIGEKLKLINVAVIALDARAPGSTLSPDLLELLSGKACIVVLNKSDLADEHQTKLWTERYKKQFGTAIHFNAMRDSKGTLLNAISKAAAPIIEKYAQKGVKKTIRVLVAGVPNAGKSAIINRLVGRKSAKEGDKPGVTRGLQWVKLSDNLELLDSPGLLWPKIESQEAAAKIAIIGSLKQEILDETALAIALIEMLKEVKPGAIAARYGILENGAAHEVLEALCRKRGFLLRQAEADMERGAKVLLDEFRGGRLGRITLERCEDDGQ